MSKENEYGVFHILTKTKPGIGLDNPTEIHVHQKSTHPTYDEAKKESKHYTKYGELGYKKVPMKISDVKDNKWIIHIDDKSADDYLRKQHQDCNQTKKESLDFIEKIFADELTESTSIFNTLIADRIGKKLQERKTEIAQSFFCEKKAVDADDEEVEQKNFNDVNPWGQLKALAEPANSKEENTVTNKDGSVNKNSGTSKDGTRAKVSFNHKNSEETDVAPSVAKILIQKLELYKPEHKSRLLDSIHSNKTGYSQAVQEILQDHNSPELSSYKFKSGGELNYQKNQK